MLTADERAEAQRLCDAATPGPWEAITPAHLPEGSGGFVIQRKTDVDERTLICQRPWAEGTGKARRQNEANARLIAAARDLLPKALKHIAAQEKQLRQAQAEVDGLRQRLQRALWQWRDYADKRRRKMGDLLEQANDIEAELYRWAAQGLAGHAIKTAVLDSEMAALGLGERKD